MNTERLTALRDRLSDSPSAIANECSEMLGELLGTEASDKELRINLVKLTVNDDGEPVTADTPDNLTLIHSSTVRDDGSNLEPSKRLMKVLGREPLDLRKLRTILLKELKRPEHQSTFEPLEVNIYSAFE